MQAQGKLFDGEVPRYKSTFSAFKEIIQTQGLRGLYTGVGPTVKRAAILTATQVSESGVSGFLGVNFNQLFYAVILANRK